MRMLKEMKWDALLRGLLYIVLGVVALVIPETMERTLGYLIAVALILAGAVSMIAYLLRDAFQNYYHNDFMYGMVIIAVGIAVLYKVEVVVSLIPFMLGLMILASGFVKLQDVIDMKRMEYGNWIGMLVLAVANVILGIVVILNPFKTATLLFKMLGIGLLVCGAIDMITTVYFAGKIGKYLKMKEAEALEKEKAEQDAKEQSQCDTEENEFKGEQN
ncbi:MAG: DUF308 domain-containing protein [Acetatifactor sp.]|nr:DUF308 domain-containing protein [Acetatifactor sp.]